MTALTHEIKASYAFMERNFFLSRRYWGWEIAFLVYSAAGALSISYIGRQAGDTRLLDRVRAGILAVAPRACLLPLRLPPITGAALLGLEAIGAGPAARHTARLQVARALLPEGRSGSLPGSRPE